MHELSICQALLDQVEDVARAHGAAQVEEIVLAVGPLSGVEPALLANAFEVARRGSCAAAELRLETAPVRVRCLDCGAESGCAANALLCAGCRGHRVELVNGDELILLRVRLTPAAPPAVH
jgi:hydrogenase nickel incorporation protein HypA/HybF